MTLTVGMHVMLVAVARSMFTTGADFLLVHTPNILAFGKPHHQCHRIFRFSADPTFIIVVHKSTLL
jgi:hypothetical protein